MAPRIEIRTALTLHAARKALPFAECGLAATIFLLNILVCRRLFFLRYSAQMESVESAYMSISRFAARHWGDLTWFPLWYTGMPFDRVYQPGLHMTVAMLARLAHWPVTLAYHFLTALAYCLGPVALFVLCMAATRSRPFALITAVVHSLFSPLLFLVPVLATDAGGYSHLRNLQILIHYGEGPHMTAVAIIPLAILFLHRALAEQRATFAPPAMVAIAAIVITNWPGSIGLSLAIAAYMLAQGDRFGVRQWLHFLLICGGGVRIGYALDPAIYNSLRGAECPGI